MPKPAITMTSLDVVDTCPAPDWANLRDAAAVLAEAREEESAATRTPTHYHLVDYATRVTGEGITCHRRTLFEIGGSSQIDNASQFLNEVLPGVEQVRIHHCRIIRGDRVIDALATARINVMQRERQLEQQMLDQRQTVELSIDDVRAGDIIDYAQSVHTVAGTHPLFGTFHLERVHFEWEVSIGRLGYRLVNDGDAPITIAEKASARGLDDTVDIAAGTHWEREIIAPPLQRHVSHRLPPSFFSHQLIVADRHTWREVSLWLHGYYRRAGIYADSLDEALIADIEDVDWRLPPAALVLALIRFVQNKVRYRSESGGLHTHTPKSPSETLSRRAGDCKDKSALLVLLLRRAGIEAGLALVNAALHDSLEVLPPSPFHFNHMIVRLRLDGQTHYIDPTEQNQGGTLRTLTKPEYGQALPLSDPGSELEKMPINGFPDVYELTHEFDLRDEDPRECTLTITRRLGYWRANNIRNQVAAMATERFAELRLEEALDYYELPLTVREGAHVAEDDLEHNVLTLREVYTLDMDASAVSPGQILRFCSNALLGYEMPKDEDLPVALSEDGAETYRLVVHYADPQGAVSETHEEDTPWFSYRDSITIDKNNTLVSETRLVPRCDEIRPEDIAACRDACQRLEKRRATDVPLKFRYRDTSSVHDHLRYLLPTGLGLTLWMMFVSGVALPAALPITLAACTAAVWLPKLRG